MCHLFVCSDMLKFRRKPWQWTKETGNEALLQWEKHGNYNFLSSFPGWSVPKQRKKLENGKKKTIERMETATFSAVWQKPHNAKENIENCKENKPCAICLCEVSCSNSAGNLGDGRKKLGLVPLA